MTTDPQNISFSPAVVHFQDLVRGDSATFKITLEYEDGTPYDLTGYDVNMHLRRADDSLVLALGIGDGITVTDNEILIDIAAADTEDLDQNYTYNYDVEISLGATVRTVSWGTFKTLKQFTHA